MTDKDHARLAYNLRQADRRLTDPLDLARARQRQAEQRSLDAVAIASEYRQAFETRLKVSEPSVYSRESPHSFFQDVMRVGRNYGGRDQMSADAARERLAKHGREVAAGEEARKAADTRARHATENALSATSVEARALERFLATGYSLMEQRSVSRTDSEGGYFTIPEWLVSDFVPAARAGQPFASLWKELPLPRGVTTLNIPQIVTGSAMPFTTDLGRGGGRDIADAFVSVQTVTAVGQADMARAWLELNPLPAADAIIMPDLAADLATQLDAQCLLGSGSGGALSGVLPGGATTAGCTITSTNNDSSTPQTFINSGSAAGTNPPGSLFQTMSQLPSVINRSRNAAPTHWVMPSTVLWWMRGQLDGNGQPVIRADAPDVLMGLPVVTDPQLPQTFGGSGPPSIGLSDTGQYATRDGSGSYPVILCGKWDDCYLWSSPAPQLRVLSEVLSGNAMVRVQAWSYHAATPVRFQAASAITISDPGSFTTGGVVKGKGVSFGVYNCYQANGPLASLGAY